jgi:peroxiredoxin
LAQLESHQEKIAEAGLKMVAVAMGEPKHAIRYCGKLRADLDCYCNKEGDVYHAYGIGKLGVAQLLNVSFAKATLRASAAGHVQGKATGDERMLPGTFIVDTNGVIRYTYYSKHAGDHPDLDVLIPKWKASHP